MDDLVIEESARQSCGVQKKNGFFYVLDRASGELAFGGQLHVGQLGVKVDRKTGSRRTQRPTGRASEQR